MLLLFAVVAVVALLLGACCLLLLLVVVVWCCYCLLFAVHCLLHVIVYCVLFVVAAVASVYFLALADLSYKKLSRLLVCCLFVKQQLGLIVVVCNKNKHYDLRCDCYCDQQQTINNHKIAKPPVPAEGQTASILIKGARADLVDVAVILLISLVILVIVLVLVVVLCR